MTTAQPEPGAVPLTRTAVGVTGRTGRLGRAHVIALEAAVGCLAAGIAFGGVTGYCLAAAGAAVAALTLLRWRGRGASGHLVRWLRRGTLGATPEAEERAEAAVSHYGLAGALLPRLEVTEEADRNGHTVGVVGDGRGFASVLELPGGTYPSLPAGLFGELLERDPSRLAAAQLLVEQQGLPPWDIHQRFRPTLAYRGLADQHRPLAVRSWLVLRYEPWEAPEGARDRGGGMAGARAALRAATARWRARLAADGVDAEPLDAASLAALLRQVGEPDGAGRPLRDSWAGTHDTHCLLTADVTAPGDWHGLLDVAAASGADRLVLGATVTSTDGQVDVRCTGRVVSTLAQHATETRTRLLAGLPTQARALTGPREMQEAGLVATLPLGYPARSLVAATGFAAGMGET